MLPASPSTSRRDGDRTSCSRGRTSAAVADDPEGAEVLAEIEQAWRELPASAPPRAPRVLPMEDPDENAVIVNALQRRADVVVQKSLAEGFGLTVAEAMWKARPVVATRRRHPGPDRGRRHRPARRRRGPRRLRRAAERAARRPHGAERMGQAAQARVRDLFLGPATSASTYYLV